MAIVFKNARIFSPSHSTVGNDFADSMMIEGDQIVHVGSCDEMDTEDATVVDLQNRIVMPGFIDAHVHMLQYGLSLHKLDVISCTSLEQIRQTIKSYAVSHPSVPRIQCRGWIQSSIAGDPLAIMLDDLDPRPIYIEAADFHSMWCNSAALDEMQAHNTPDPPGGTIHRDENGRASGLLSESAFINFAWPFLERITSKKKKLSALRAAITSYTAAGYTGVVDMAMSEETWEILSSYRNDNKIPLHIAVHWLVPFSNNQQTNFSFVDRAFQLHHQQSNSPDFHVSGIKLMADGVVDGCTAALTHSYGGKRNPIDPIWPTNLMTEVISRADSAGLQCAIHAIGDQAVHQSINILSQVGTPGRRHRIEHLELTSREDAKRLGQLGIIASVQPVHSDPAHFKAWPGLIGEERCKRAFAYKEFLDGGAPLAFGTDAPTALHFPFSNMYNATTRRSAIETERMETVNPQFALGLVEAMTAYTQGAAYARFAETWTGSLKAGLSADFVVVDMAWMPERLLEAKVCQTWYRGQKVFDSDD